MNRDGQDSSSPEINDPGISSAGAFLQLLKSPSFWSALLLGLLVGIIAGVWITLEIFESIAMGLTNSP